jgi:hypothetical protein
MIQKKLLILLLTLFLVNTAQAQLFKTIDVGKTQAYVYDHGCMSEDVRPCGNVYYFRGSYVTWDDINYNDNFEWPGGLLKDAGLLFGARNWTDTTGYTWDACITGHAARKRENRNYQFAVPDEEGYFIRRYMRYPLPQIIVDGVHLEAPFPMSGDEVNPAYIAQWGGTADVMVESNVRLSMGLDVKQRVLAWSQPGHDDYIIWDWTFVNTGNVDRDPEIELPGQTLTDVYITRVIEAMINGTGDNKVMDTWAGTTEDQDTRLSYPQDDDSLRINYVTPLRAKGAGYDSYGKKPGTARTLMDGARFGGSAVLFAPKACDVPQSHPISDVSASNDPAQPSMHTSVLGNPSFIVWDFPGMDSAGYLSSYEVMVKGVFGIDSTSPNFQDAYYMDSVYNVYDTTASGAKTHYEQPLDRWGELDPSRGWIYMTDIPEGSDYRRFDQQEHFSIGPYQMEFGDTLRYVYAYVGGAISRKTSYLLGDAWNNGRAASYSWLAELDSAQMVDELRRRDPIFDIYYDTDPGIDPTPSLNDIAKDLMVATGKDSLFNNGMNAQRNFNMNYNIPASPAPPSYFAVNSRSDMIELSWDYENGVSSNLAGFKIYRAAGAYVFSRTAGIILGDWQFLDSVGPAETLYGDTTSITPGADYYYALTAVSDQGVESGMFLTMTVQAARLTSSPASNLDSVRVVPNPLNINNATVGRYSEGEGNKLTFVNLPGYCTITILTESGNLVKTIEHNSGSGIAQWYDGQRYLVTDSDQHPVSGVYIAHIRDNNTGESVSLKFVIVR